MARRSGSSRPSGGGLLILDGHGLFCAGLEELFRRARGFGDIASATGLQAGARLARRLAPRVILTRPRLDNHTPFEVARALRRRSSPSRLVFLDDAVRHVHVRIGVWVGVSGYWTKHADFPALAEAVRVVAAGGTAFCPAVRRFIDVTPKRLKYCPAASDRAIHKLTRREVEVLALLGAGLTVKQCAERLERSPSTVDNHKCRLMQKLGVHKTVELAVLATREGLLDEGPAHEALST